MGGAHRERVRQEREGAREKEREIERESTMKKKNARKALQTWKDNTAACSSGKTWMARRCGARTEVTRGRRHRLRQRLHREQETMVIPEAVIHEGGKEKKEKKYLDLLVMDLT
ncbi:hypothetical protein Scep_024572 [Stephania cephalantha]|uniref:Uncharacterized protein n=1 Tax=Stephania cephalantha TaxID=152367 RepID=A0AAP0HX88_9MAGN